MKLLWQYLKPHRNLVFLSLFLAAVAQLASLIDPVIFGHIIDRFASHKQVYAEGQLMSGIVYWLLIVLGVALLSKLLNHCRISLRARPSPYSVCRYSMMD
jgi:ATP-binding cassette subfamily B protein